MDIWAKFALFVFPFSTVQEHLFTSFHIISACLINSISKQILTAIRFPFVLKYANFNFVIGIGSWKALKGVFPKRFHNKILWCLERQSRFKLLQSFRRDFGTGVKTLRHSSQFLYNYWLMYLFSFKYLY